MPHLPGKSCLLSLALMTGTPALAQTVVEATRAHILADGRMLVATTAVVERAGIPGVFLVHAGRARFRMVRTGGRVAPGETVILSGLKGNETIIARPQQLTDGAKVGMR